MNWQEYHFKYFKNYCEAVGTLTCPRVPQMGIVEELGSGTKKMFKYTPFFSDGKEPVIEEQDVYRITIPFDSLSVETIESTEKSKEKSKEKVLALIKENNQITTRQMMAECQLSENAIYKIIRQLRESGFIEREGGRKEGSWKVLK